MRLNLFENWSLIRSQITLQTDYFLFKMYRLDLSSSGFCVKISSMKLSPYIRLSNLQLSASWLLNPLMDLADGTNNSRCWPINQSDWIQLARSTAGRHDLTKYPKKLSKFELVELGSDACLRKSLS